VPMPATRAVYACAKLSDGKRQRASQDATIKTEAVRT
jgi:hypothetical protein